MSKNRVIYQTEALYVGPSPSTGVQMNSGDVYNFGYEFIPRVKQLFRIQSANYGYSLSRRDVNQYGELAAIDRALLESPSVTLDFSYLNTTFYNESSLGFYINSGQGDSSAISYILNKTQDDKNYFIKTTEEGVDAIMNSGIHKHQFISIGNGFITNFSTEGSIGDFPRTNINVEGLNILYQAPKSSSPNTLFDFYTTDSHASGFAIIDNPAINPSNGRPINTGALDPSDTSAQPFVQYNIIPVALSSPATGDLNTADGVFMAPSPAPFNVSALRPGDITIDFLNSDGTTVQQEAGVLISDAKIQSYNLNFNLSRDPLQKLGSKYAFAREIRFPIQVNLSVEANVGDLYSGNLVDVINNDSFYNVRIKIKHPQSGSINLMTYTLKGAKLDSQNFTSSIGPNKSVSLNLSSQIGGPLQFNKGLFFSGMHVIN